MADLGAANWSETDASNTTAAPDGMPEGMAPSGVNDWGRATMGAVKRWFNHLIPKTTAGTTTAYTLTYTVAPGAYIDGETYLVRFNATNGAAPTINVNALGAIPIYKYSSGAWAAVASGDLTADSIARLSYNTAAGAFFVTSFSATAIGAAFLATANAFAGNNTFAGTSTFSGTASMSGKAFNEAATVDVASATTADIGAAASNTVRITGTVTITGLGTVSAGVRRTVRFAGALTLTHSATALILPTSANIVTVANDTADFLSLGAGNWICTNYQRVSGAALVGAGITSLSSVLAADVALNDATLFFDANAGVAQGTSGTFLAIAKVCFRSGGGGLGHFKFKLWDGTNLIDTADVTTPNSVLATSTTLAGLITNPVANIKISVQSITYTTALIVANDSGLGKDTQLTVIKIG